MALDFENPEANVAFSEALRCFGATCEDIQRIEVACYARGSTLGGEVLRSLFTALEYDCEPLTLPVPTIHRD
jgi:hypothetical protein